MATTHSQEKTGEILLDLRGCDAHIHLYTRLSQGGDASARDLRVGVLHRDDGPTNARLNQCRDAGTGSTLVAAGLQCDIGRGTVRLLDSAQCHDFGMRFAIWLGKS